MKKLLIITTITSAKKKLLADYLNQQLNPKGTEVLLGCFSDLSIYVQNNDICIYLDELNIKEVDLIYFRRAGSKYLSLAGTLAVCLNRFKIPFYDTTFDNLGPAGDKFTSYIRLANAGLPVIPSYFCWHSRIQDKKQEIINKLGLPLVAKQLSSQRGRGVFLIHQPADFELVNKYPEEEFLFQKYFPSNEEYRVLVLKNTIGAFEKKIRTDKQEFRSNVALGAREEFIDVTKIPSKIKKMAIKAAQTLRVEIAGVDVLVDKTGNQWLLEVNRGPGLTYDPKTSPELNNLAKFFHQQINDKKNKFWHLF